MPNEGGGVVTPSRVISTRPKRPSFPSPFALVSRGSSIWRFPFASNVNAKGCLPALEAAFFIVLRFGGVSGIMRSIFDCDDSVPVAPCVAGWFPFLFGRCGEGAGLTKPPLACLPGTFRCWVFMFVEELRGGRPFAELLAPLVLIG